MQPSKHSGGSMISKKLVISWHLFLIISMLIMFMFWGASSQVKTEMVQEQKMKTLDKTSLADLGIIVVHKS